MIRTPLSRCSRRPAGLCRFGWSPVCSSHQLPCGPTRTLRLAHLALGSNRPAGSSRQPVVVNERFCGCLEQDCSSRPLIVVLGKSYRFRRARDLRGGACSHSKARHAAFFFARARHPHAHMRLVVRPWLLATVWCVAGCRSQAYCGGRACDCFIFKLQYVSYASSKLV